MNMKNSNIKITENTDAVDIDQKCLGLNATRESFPRDIRDHIHKNRGLKIQIRHNGDAQTHGQANYVSRLISAAPELLKELKHLVNLLGDGPYNVPGLATLNAAKAAIAKAEGTNR